MDFEEKKKNAAERYGIENKYKCKPFCLHLYLFACFITTTNQYRECPVQNPIKVQRGVPLGRTEDFSLWYLEFRLQSWFLGGSLGMWHNACFYPDLNRRLATWPR